MNEDKLICKICGKECKDRRGLARHLQLLHKYNFEELKKYYDLYFKLNNEGICKTCGSDIKFYGLTHGYSKFYCNMKCISNNEEIKKKKEKTCLEKYGETTNLKCKDTKEKIKQTCLKKYGCANPSKNLIIKKKKLNTSII